MDAFVTEPMPGWVSNDSKAALDAKVDWCWWENGGYLIVHRNPGFGLFRKDSTAHDGVRWEQVGADQPTFEACAWMAEIERRQ